MLSICNVQSNDYMQRPNTPANVDAHAPPTAVATSARKWRGGGPLKYGALRGYGTRRCALDREQVVDLAELRLLVERGHACGGTNAYSTASCGAIGRGVRPRLRPRRGGARLRRGPQEGRSTETRAGRHAAAAKLEA